MELPADVVLVTMSIDVQNQYLAILTSGWSLDGEVWLLDYEKVEADPRDHETWRQLATYAPALSFEQPAHPKKDVPIHIIGIDSGFLTDSVYDAARLVNAARGRRCCYPTKGVGGLTAEPLILPVRDERDPHGRRGVRPLRFNADEAKSEFMAMLGVKKAGPGYVHISKRLAETDLMAELTSEELRTKFDPDGVACGVQWKKKTPDARNEALDCACIALVLHRFLSRQDWFTLLVARYGQADAVRRFKARHPETRIRGVDA